MNYNNSNIIKDITKSGITRLTLNNFRNYDFLRINTDLSSVVITGENGVGKTNILEAISFLTPGRGMRSSKLSDVRKIGSLGQPWAISATISHNEEEFELGTGVEATPLETDSRTYEKRIVKIDNDKISSQMELGKYISAIWLTPQMDRLFRGGSAPRRSFLDRLVYAFDIEHAKRTSTFEHLSKEWAQILKTQKHDDTWLNSIEENMAGIGVAIAAARREQIARLNSFIEKEPDDIFPNVSLELDGTIERMLDDMPAIDVEDQYRGMLKKMRQNVIYNVPIDGVSRTDFKLYYKEKNMPAELCSTGEQKSLLIGVILAQTKCQSIYKGFSPILLLDEVASHLDEIKREALLEKIKDMNLQTWITSTDADLFASMKNEAQFLTIKDGKVTQTK